MIWGRARRKSRKKNFDVSSPGKILFDSSSVGKKFFDGPSPGGKIFTEAVAGEKKFPFRAFLLAPPDH